MLSPVLGNQFAGCRQIKTKTRTHRRFLNTHILKRTEPSIDQDELSEVKIMRTNGISCLLVINIYWSCPFRPNFPSHSFLVLFKKGSLLISVPAVERAFLKDSCTHDQAKLVSSNSAPACVCVCVCVCVSCVQILYPRNTSTSYILLIVFNQILQLCVLHVYLVLIFQAPILE